MNVRNLSICRWWPLILLLLVGILMWPIPYQMGIDRGKVGPGDVGLFELIPDEEIKLVPAKAKIHSEHPERRGAEITYRGFTYLVLMNFPVERDSVTSECLFSTRVRPGWTAYGDERSVYQRTGNFYTLVMKYEDSAASMMAAEELSRRVHAKVLKAAANEVAYGPYGVEFMEKLNARVRLEWYQLKGRMGWGPTSSLEVAREWERKGGR